MASFIRQPPERSETEPACIAAEKPTWSSADLMTLSAVPSGAWRKTRRERWLWSVHNVVRGVTIWARGCSRPGSQQAFAFRSAGNHVSNQAKCNTLGAGIPGGP